MKPIYCLGLDVAKHKLRAALAGGDGRICFEADLPVSAAGRHELLAQLRARVPAPEQLLVVSKPPACSISIGVRRSPRPVMPWS